MFRLFRQMPVSFVPLVRIRSDRRKITGPVPASGNSSCFLSAVFAFALVCDSAFRNRPTVESPIAEAKALRNGANTWVKFMNLILPFFDIPFIAILSDLSSSPLRFPGAESAISEVVIRSEVFNQREYSKQQRPITLSILGKIPITNLNL